MKQNIYKKSIQIAGSCSNDCDVEVLKYTHEFIKHLVLKLLYSGANIVTTVGDEPKFNQDSSKPSIIFYWDVLECAFDCAKSKSFAEEVINIVKVVSSENSEEKIPSDRLDLWKELLGYGIVDLKRIKPGWNSSALKRQEQESVSDAFIILGGGAGVEHSAHLHVSHGKPVFPLDLPLGASCNDGIGGASFYSRLAIAEPGKFIRNSKEDTGSKLAYLKYQNWISSPENYASAIVEFLESIITPQVFYIRMLNEDIQEFPLIENFFRDVVDPVIQINYRAKEIGKGPTTEAFLNVEIFKEINNSSLVIADLTGLRLNCFMEMGFAFGLSRKVILTAKNDTDLPFDPKAIPCFLWDPLMPPDKQQEEFFKFILNNLNRPPIVSPSEII